MLTTLDVAKGMQRKHSKLMRDIDWGGDRFGTRGIPASTGNRLLRRVVRVISG